MSQAARPAGATALTRESPASLVDGAWPARAEGGGKGKGRCHPRRPGALIGGALLLSEEGACPHVSSRVPRTLE